MNDVAGDAVVNWARIWTVTRTDLKQLIQAKDFWIPMLILGGIFFLFVPTILLLSITAIGDVQAVAQISQALEVLPEQAQAAVRGDTDAGRAVLRPRRLPVRPGGRRGAADHLHRRRRLHDRRRARAGHRRVPGPLPRRGQGDLPRQADRQPPARLRHDAARLRDLLAGREPDRRPRGRRLVLPHPRVVGADALGRPAVPGPDPVDRPAPVGPGEVDRRRPAGLRPRDPAADHGRLLASRPAPSSAPPRPRSGSAPSPGSWPSPASAAACGSSPAPASSASPTASRPTGPLGRRGDTTTTGYDGGAGQIRLQRAVPSISREMSPAAAIDGEHRDTERSCRSRGPIRDSTWRRLGPDVRTAKARDDPPPVVGNSSARTPPTTRSPTPRPLPCHRCRSPSPTSRAQPPGVG